MDRGFELLLNNVPFPMWVKDLDLKFTYINDAYAQLYNKNKEDFLGYKYEEICNDFYCETYQSHCKSVIKSRKPKTEKTHINKKYVQYCIFPIINDSNELVAIVGILGILNNKELEEKDLELESQKNLTKQIIDILPGVIFYKDIESRYVYANKACTDFYKEKGIDNIFGRTDIDLNSNKKIAENIIRDDINIIETKKTIYKEYITERKDGTIQYQDVVKIPLIDKFGDVKGIVGRIMDVTDQKAYEEKLKYLSYTDILTGVKNRTYFDERILELSEKENLPLGVIMGDANGLKIVNDTFGHEEGDKLLKLTANILSETCKDVGEIFRIGGDEFVILIPNTSQRSCENIIKKINEKCDEYDDDILKVNISLGASVKISTKENVYDVFKEAEDKVYRQKLLKERNIKGSILTSLRIGLGTKSIETEEHTERVSKYATLVGKKLDLGISEIDELIIVGELHDIGKIGISEEILLKAGELSDEEYNIMKTHTEKGYRIVKASSELENVAKGVLYHHERWDGKGYPMGLKGEEIPLISRIISVVDAYDVMTNDRVYKKAIEEDDAIEELKRCSGTQFDPDVVERFIECIKHKNMVSY